jgi:hypothetical protein
MTFCSDKKVLTTMKNKNPKPSPSKGSSSASIRVQSRAVKRDGS